MLDLDPGMMIWTWITFIIVLVLLSKLALKPMLTAINNREDQIRNDIDEARKQREESEGILKKHQELIDGAEAEAQKIINENKQLAEKTKQSMVESARAEADKIIENAKKEIEQQKESALASLRSEVAELAVGAAERIIIKKLDKSEHEKVVEEYLKSMPKSIKN
jgi:F-type H+-transporting ATPase subunit b